MRLDQDIRFSVKGVPLVMRLLTCQAGGDDKWIVTPENDIDKGNVFRRALSSLPSDFIDPIMGITISEAHAILGTETREGRLPVREAIIASLPDWDGESLGTLTYGSDAFAGLLNALRFVGIQEFHRADGSPIEFESFVV